MAATGAPSRQCPRRPGLRPLGLVADQRGGVGEQAPRVLRPAVDAVLPQPVAGFPGNRRERQQLRVRLIVAGQKRQRGAVLAARGRDLLDPVGPVAEPAEQPHHHQARARDHRFGVEVDREVVRQVHQVGQAQAGEVLGQIGPRRGQVGELAVGGREHHDGARALAQVDRLGTVRDTAGLGGEQVHIGPPDSRPAPSPRLGRRSRR